MLAFSISFLDGGTKAKKENFYHGLLLGMLNANKIWDLSSNREAGDGRADIIIEPKSRLRNDYGIIIELKYASDEDKLKNMAEKALTQIQKMNYDGYFRGELPENVKHYGISFYKKKCMVLMGE